MTTPAPSRPLPQFPEPDTEPFWQATKDRKLTYQVDSAGNVVFYPRRHALASTSLDLQWRESEGRGTIYTFTVIRQHGHPFFRGKIPYVVAYVDLDEGFRMLTEIAGVDPANVRIGQRVRVEWEEHEAVNIPVFVPEEVARG